ncbi:uncharacterized protein LOC133925662 [Phragmites australis]|uniref:uncharacterized protein LOC133925662 n=1 Tax=Phragmites australis TaxID=29695 RepID=UPI002D797CD3|nr:uncharacterized protein LOC133925662 [Phragmites australis]
MAVALLADIESNKRPKHGGSVPGRVVVCQDRQLDHARLVEHYFAEVPVYGEATFRRRFRMSRELLLRIANAVEAHCPYFKQKRNAARVLGHSVLQKITTSMCMISCGVPADSVDDYLRIGESTPILSLRKLVKAVIEIFGGEYLRAPTTEDTARLMAIGAARGFLGMLGCIDFMDWRWKNCPTTWHGQFNGHFHDPTIILEAVASHDLWIWHAYFGLPVSRNDINILQ